MVVVTSRTSELRVQKKGPGRQRSGEVRKLEILGSRRSAVVVVTLRALRLWSMETIMAGWCGQADGVTACV